jgi:hypothetical protein
MLAQGTTASEETTITVVLDLLTSLLSNTATSPEKQRIALAKAQATVVWLQTFHVPSLRRKQQSNSRTAQVTEMQVTNPGPGTLVLEGADAHVWEKSIQSTLKKIVTEDLGNMNATELVPTIPETDPEGRGMQDLQATEKKLSVKIVFDEDTGHVFLVGDAKKLEKKCFVLRNMLSHYHWRLSGTDVSFSSSKPH